MDLLNIKNQRNHFAILLLVYVLLLSGLFVKGTYTGLKNGIILKVRTHTTGIGVYKHYTIPGKGYFISGMEGDLYWRPANLTESMLLITANDQRVDLVDITGILITGCFILVMFKNSQNGLVFNSNIVKEFMMVIFCIMITTIVLDLAKMRLARHYIPYITQGKFVGNHTFKLLNYNYMIYPLLLFLMRIPKRGLELQQEADLTI